MPRPLQLLRRFLPLLVSLAVLAYLFAWRSPLDENLSRVASLDRGLLLAAAGLGIVSFACQALRLRLLVGLLGTRLGLPRALVYTLVGHFYSSAIPGGSVGGDAVKALYLSQSTRSKPQAFAAVLVDRLCGLFMLAALALAALLPSIHEPGKRQAAVVILLFTGGALLAILLLTSRRVRSRLPAGTAGRLPFSGAIRAFDAAMQVYRGQKRGLLYALLLSALPQAGWIGMHIAIGHALGVDVGWLEYAVVIPVAGMIAALPVSFGGWGVGEAATAHFLAQTAETSGAAATLFEQGAILSAVGRVVQLFWALAGLAASWALPRPKDLKAALEGDPLMDDPPDDP
jgi:glycosyltransferase 2 family protein